MAPRGKLIAIGGAENRNHFEKEKLDVLARILKEMKGGDTIIEIIPTASRGFCHRMQQNQRDLSQTSFAQLQRV